MRVAPQAGLQLAADAQLTRAGQVHGAAAAARRRRLRRRGAFGPVGQRPIKGNKAERVRRGRTEGARINFRTYVRE